jgi:hypothetical protein
MKRISAKDAEWQAAYQHGIQCGAVLGAQAAQREERSSKKILTFFFNAGMTIGSMIARGSSSDEVTSATARLVERLNTEVLPK